jgi:hypothetical protein
MTTPDDGGDSPPRALLVALVAMAGVALLVGLAVGGAAVTVMSFAGVGSDESRSTSRGEESLFIPRYKPTETVETDLGLPGQSDAPSGKKEKPSKEPSPRTDRIKLFVAPQSVGPGERINFNGVYVDGEGVALQVQRKEAGTWTDFPVTATVRGGVFSTWIQTSRTGEAAFRVFDGDANRASNVVRVTIG